MIKRQFIIIFLKSLSILYNKLVLNLWWKQSILYINIILLFSLRFLNVFYLCNHLMINLYICTTWVHLFGILFIFQCLCVYFWHKQHSKLRIHHEKSLSHRVHTDFMSIQLWHFESYERWESSPLQSQMTNANAKETKHFKVTTVFQRIWLKFNLAQVKTNPDPATT